jgi:hypothetical protein
MTYTLLLTYLECRMHSLFHYKMIPQVATLLSTLTECSSNVCFWHQYILLVHQMITFDHSTKLQNSGSFPAVVHLYWFLPLYCCRLQGKWYNTYMSCVLVPRQPAGGNMKWLIPTKDVFPLPWHDKILLTLDLIYASIFCVFVNNAMHLLKNNLSCYDVCMELHL